MPECKKCGQALVCPSHRLDHELSEMVESCREDCAVWVRVQGRKRGGEEDLAPIPGVEGVTVTVGEERELTDGLGFAGFDPLPPGSHTARILLSEALAEVYRDPDPAELTEVVPADQIKMLTFGLTARARLTLRVVERGNHEHGFDGAAVTVTGGPETLRVDTRGGTAVFGPMRARTYQVAVVLADRDTEAFVSPRASEAVVLGEVDREAVIEIEPVNVVTPTLEAPTPVVARVRPGVTIAPTKLELCLEQTNRDAHPFAKSGKLQCVPADVVEVFTDQTCETPLLDGALGDRIAETEALPLWLRGVALGTVSLTFVPDDPEDAAVRLAEASVAIEVEVVDVALPVAVAAVLPPRDKPDAARLELMAVGTPAPGTYAWKPLAEATADAAIASADRDHDRLVIEAREPGTAVAEVEYALERAPEVKARAKSTAIFFRVEPTVSVIAVDAVGGSTLEPAVEGLPDAGERQWTLGEQDFEAATEGALDGTTLAVKATKAGLAAVQLAYTPEGADAAVVATGAVAFVGAAITKITKEVDAIADVPAPGARPAQYEVLVDLVEAGGTEDPAEWKTGHVLLEAAGTPGTLTAVGLDDVPGTYDWSKPVAGGLLCVAAAQPDAEHAQAKPKVLIRAVPKAGPVGPSAAPGYEDESIEVTFDLQGVQAKDDVTVRVHRNGCSQVTWQRAGAGVDHHERLEICTHDANPQSNGLLNATPPPGGAGVAPVEPRGHQHGGWCYICSGAAVEGGANAPRDVWHWVPVSATVLTHARALAPLLVTFFNDVNAVSATYQHNHAGQTNGNTLFTDEVWEHFQKLRTQPRRWRGPNWGRNIAHYTTKGRMFGVLRGYTGLGAMRWLYAMSGESDLGGDWCPPLDVGRTPDTQRDIPSYEGAAATYVKTNGPFNVGAMTGGWHRFGRCAAPALLGQALALGLQRIELTEIWLHPTGGGHYTDRHEIGSCEQCRRYLGRMLCERGPRP